MMRSVFFIEKQYKNVKCFKCFFGILWGFLDDCRKLLNTLKNFFWNIRESDVEEL